MNCPYTIRDANGVELTMAWATEESAMRVAPLEGRKIFCDGVEVAYASDGTWWKWEDPNCARKVGA